MCGIFCSLSSRSHAQPSEAAIERLKCRGPDSERTLRLQVGSPACHVTLCSTVLSLRGYSVIIQPYTGDDDDYVLCWNGEAWHIDGETGIENDTTSVHTLLRQALDDGLDESRPPNLSDRASTVATALSRIAGPYAFTFLDRRRGHLYFGRDFLGRRSLCWSRNTKGDFAICSMPDRTFSPSWLEVEADGINCIDLGDSRKAFQLLASTCVASRGSSPHSSVPYKFIGEDGSVRCILIVMSYVLMLR